MRRRGREDERRGGERGSCSHLKWVSVGKAKRAGSPPCWEVRERIARCMAETCQTNARGLKQWRSQCGERALKINGASEWRPQGARIQRERGAQEEAAGPSGASPARWPARSVARPARVGAPLRKTFPSGCTAVPMLLSLPMPCAEAKKESVVRPLRKKGSYSDDMRWRTGEGSPGMSGARMDSGI